MAEYLTDNFSLQEMVRSSYATRMGLDNTPTRKQRENLVKVCEVLEGVRDMMGGRSLFVSSGLRKGKVNDGQGGARNSVHKLGLAADLDNLPGGNYEAFLEIAPYVLRNELPIDQIIGEFFIEDEPRAGWIHIGLARGAGEPRYQILRAAKVSGRTRYSLWDEPWGLA